MRIASGVIIRTILVLALCFLVSAVMAKKAAKSSGTTKLKSVGVSVYGTAVSIKGKALANVKGHCQSLSSGTGPDWTSGNDGKFRLTLKPGKYRIWSVGAEQKSVKFLVPADDGAVHVNVISSPHNGLLLKFESPVGKALSNTRISCGEMGGSASLKIDANGFGKIIEFNVPLHLFFVRKGVGYADLNITSEETLFGEDPVVVRLNSGVFVSGRVVSNQDSVPVGGVPVFPERISQKDDPWSWWNTQYGFKSFSHTMTEKSMAISRDGDGAFSLGPLPPGNYSLTAGLPGISQEFPSTDLIEVTSKDVDLSGGVNLDGLELGVSTNKPVYSLHGRVLKSDKTPLASKEIIIEVSGDYAYPNEPEECYVWEPVVRSVITDAQGKYRLYPIRPGKYKLVAKWEKFSATKIVDIHTDVAIDFTLH